MAEAGIYCGPALLTDPTVIEDLKGSGFTTVVAWPIRVSRAGDLVFDDLPFVREGRWVGDDVWPARLAALKDGGSVNRLLFSVGSGESADFTQIHALMAEHGTGPSSPLTRNFSALKAAIPVIDAIDFDNEDHLDVETNVAFGRLLAGLGWPITFCPYKSREVWLESLAALWGWRPGCVAGLHLQCYSGGAGNDPSDWKAAIARLNLPGLDLDGFIHPGLWCVHGDPCAVATDSRCPESVQGQMATWAKECGIQGGWVFLLEHLLACAGSGACPGGTLTLAGYAEAIRRGIEGQPEG
ncbi:MAG: hypothetical protein ACRDJU_09365 [Actinomycetota bacterium]